MHISVEKPGSPEEVLAHHGVKGQKWGVRRRSKATGRQAGVTAARAASKAGAGRVEARAAGRQAGTAAAKKSSATSRASSKSSFDRANPTSRSKASAIYRARTAQQHRAMIYRTTPKGPARNKAKQTFLKHPDRATALRMSRGEKVVYGVIAGVFAVPSMGVVPAAIGVGVGGQYAARKRVEKKQARGGYN